MSTNNASVTDALNAQSGAGQSTSGISIKTFLASLATAITVFLVEFLLFLLLKGKLTRIYQPRTYLVPERERTRQSPAGLFRWVAPVFRTSNSEFIQKCGLDAYFFLRYLRMLLKIFLPLSIIIIPVLIPLNVTGGRDRHPVGGHTNGSHYNVTGLDQLAWGNVRPEHVDRYWAHLILAVIVIVYVCAVFFDELRGYIRLRQAYLTSPQHRLRASATTVLVTTIPHKWLSVDALDGLYDVFPGGVRNIWINRNLDELNEKVKLRSKLALMLESAETELVKKCKRAQLKKAKSEAKKAGKSSRDAESREKAATDKRAAQLAESAGVSSGNPHQVAHTVQEALGRGNGTQSRSSSTDRNQRRALIPIVEGSVGAVGHGVAKLGKSVLGGLKKVSGGVDERLHMTGGFAADESENTAPTDEDQIGDGIAPGYRLQHLRGDGAGGVASRSAHNASENHTDRPSSGGEHEGEPATDEQADHPPGRQPGAGGKLSKKPPSSKYDRHGDEYPLTLPSPQESSPKEKSSTTGKGMKKIFHLKRHGGAKEGDKLEDQAYPVAFNEEFEEDDYGEPMWRKYIKEKDRETMRLPIFGWSWMPTLPLLGKKVDTIYYCRKEVARLNLEIEIDQQEPEKFPLMNSAFVQFNHQVAAHMACQCVSHHLPKQMAPRLVEISPDDVIWDNMSIKWWERYLRTFGVIVIVSAMVVGWAFPVAFTGLLSQLAYLEGRFSWLQWLSQLPTWLLSAIQGILPPLFLAILMALLPLMLRFLSKNQGVHTGMAVELTVQNYYFAFLFVQLFLVVSISSGFTTIFKSIKNVTSVPQLMAENIPKASNYFFSYMILQAMSVSAGALVQIFGLVSWFILAPLLDNTARTKWARTTNLNQMQWGTFFPVYTTLASIGLIYCVISPLIMVFNVITFGLFWFVYRYNTLYVTKFRFDTGGLLFPKAINQLFTGIYVMEICLIGMFFLVRDQHNSFACKGQAICMIVVLVVTALYQYLLNEAFNPLFRYLPITLEDDAVRRDEEFARAQRRRLGLEDDGDDGDGTEQRKEEERVEDIGLNQAGGKTPRRGTYPHNFITSQISRLVPSRINSKRISWADRSQNRRSRYFGGRSDATMPSVQRMRQKLAEDAEAQGPSTKAIGRALFSGIHDDLEDLTPDERDQLVQRAFQHEALRARRPVIWIPRDDLGVSDDEVFRTQRFSKHIWISNEYQALDGRCRAIFSRSPPDFSEVDLIQL